MPKAFERERDYRARNVVAAVLNEVWAIEPRKLDQIVAFLEMRADGITLSEEEIRASMALRARSSFDDFVQPLDRADGRMISDGVEVLGLYDTLGPRLNLMMEFSGGTSTQKFGQALDRAIADPDVHAVLIEVDSPGGVTTGTEELRQKLLAARDRKPVVAVARGMMASAAYYIGSAASQVVATPSTEVGSIGVYMVTRDVTKAAEQQGVKFHVFRAGDLKASGNPYEALSEARMKAVQARVDGPYTMFLSAVSENRGISVDQVKQNYGQGTVFLADEALRRGMIDRVASIAEVFDELRRQNRVQPPAGTSSQAHAINPPCNVRAAETATPSQQETSLMNPRIKAALYAMGLIEAVDAADNLCQAALGGFFRGQVPKGDDEILRGLTAGVQAANTPAASSAAASPPANQGAASAQAARDQELAEARTAERERISAIHTRAALLNRTGFAVSGDAVTKAIADGISAAEAADRWLQAWQPTQATGGTENPLGRVSAIGSEVDQFVAAASDGLVIRGSRQGAFSLPTGFTPSPGAEQASRMTAMDIARRDLQLSGQRFDPHADAESIAAQWLRMHSEFRIYAVEGGVTGASYPNLLSAFMAKSLDTSIMLRETTFRRWMAQHPSVPDFNPRLVVGQSDAGYLPEIAGDRDEAPEGSTAEEAMAWFQVHRRGKSLVLTPYMITQDQLGAFANSFGLLQLAQDRTIDQMGIDLLIANPTLLDGGALFNTTAVTSAGGHANLSASGAAPSAARAKANRLLMRAQPGIGSTEAGELEPSIVLVPDELEEAAKQTFYTTARLNEVVMKSTDTSINIYRGTIADIISSARLSAASAVAWYEFTSLAMAPLKYVYQTGYENGRRDSWWDPKTQCRYFRHETRVAVFVAGWRGAVKDPGQ